ncbi:MAG TPA: hypothetical protein VK796_05440 [Cytophaga sp.]|jgi:hypothetical protein|nr:hypothetical protein [Cytophaga sp.]
MKRLFVYAGIVFICSIQSCNSSSAPGTTYSDSTTNDSAYDRSTATERVVKPGVKKENTNKENLNSENTKNENINNADTLKENLNSENTNKENRKTENAPQYNPIGQDTLTRNNGVHLNANEVPLAVVSALHIRYPTVYKVRWVMNDNRKPTLYIAHWQAHNNKMMAVFAEDGMFIRESSNNERTSFRHTVP